MRLDIYRYVFKESVPMDQAEATLQLAVIAAEGLYGQARVRLDAAYVIDQAKRVLVVDGRGPIGRCICRIFTAYLKQEFGDDAFKVRSVSTEIAQEVSA